MRGGRHRLGHIDGSNLSTALPAGSSRWAAGLRRGGLGVPEVACLLIGGAGGCAVSVLVQQFAELLSGDGQMAAQVRLRPTRRCASFRRWPRGIQTLRHLAFGSAEPRYAAVPRRGTDPESRPIGLAQGNSTDARCRLRDRGHRFPNSMLWAITVQAVAESIRQGCLARDAGHSVGSSFRPRPYTIIASKCHRP